VNYISINLKERSEQSQGKPPKDLFPHQGDAIQALTRCFSFGDDQTKGALLVLPTGAGKTFTTVKWLCDYVIPQGIKVLWLAHAFHLLDQAFETIDENAQWIPKREFLNIRVISSHPSHDKPSSVQPTDDIVIMTTQTAIRNLNVDALDQFGKVMVTNFRKFIESCQKTGLCIVLDEAHHAPAYGCRHLLMDIRNIIPNLYLLGLTATPTYTDETQRGWLAKIFERGVIFESKQPDLIAQNILARPKFIEMPTGREFEVDDALYTRLVREHKDLPENIVDKLATDAPRNDYIINEYVSHQREYGKTIIFADRWFQCVYLKEKLNDKGVKADAIYSHIDADPGSAEARNQRTSDDNQKILKRFRDGKGDHTLDVLINVRMLTEGVDVPDVKTVFITRQTTSSILMTQMLGRALRGKRAGGGDDKTEANIVLFVDQWKRLINWASPSLEGGLDDSRRVRGYYPLEYISIRLVEELTKQINLPGTFPPLSFIQTIPAGWYQTEVVVNTSEDNSDEMQSFTEFVMVYEHTKPKFEPFMEFASGNLWKEWAKEHLAVEWMQPQVNQWLDHYFDKENDNIGNTLELDLARIARHIAQKKVLPVYHSFEERDQYDLDELAREVLEKEMSDLAQDHLLRDRFSKPGSLWQVFYKTYDRFNTALFFAKQRQLDTKRHGNDPPVPGNDPPLNPVSAAAPTRELTEQEKKQVKKRDNYTCLACGAHGKGIRLQIDHIVPVKMGGETSVDNSQTLCSVCNREKGINEVNFKIHSRQLRSSKDWDPLPRYGSEDVKQSITRLVNFYYHCQAVCEVRLHKTRRGTFYSTWEVELFAGNDPNWLLQHKQSLVTHIQDKFGCPHVKDIRIISTA
jgi:superfamily II DNA or RNA helicase